MNFYRQHWRIWRSIFNWFKKRMCSYTTYIDEAGNTYTDLQNTDQPYFVIAAVSVPKENRRKVLEVRKKKL